MVGDVAGGVTELSEELWSRGVTGGMTGLSKELW